MSFGDYTLPGCQHTVSGRGPRFYEDVTSVLEMPANRFDLPQGNSSGRCLD